MINKMCQLYPRLQNPQRQPENGRHAFIPMEGLIEKNQDCRPTIEVLLENDPDFKLLINNIPAVVFKGYIDGSVDFFDNKINLIKIHPQAGYDILKEIPFPWPVAVAVLQHHERLNGSGYPHGLLDENIIMEAKILAVAEAIASHRPYRPALGLDHAMAEISKNQAVLYDPALVQACLNLFSEQRFTFR